MFLEPKFKKDEISHFEFQDAREGSKYSERLHQGASLSFYLGHSTGISWLCRVLCSPSSSYGASRHEFVLGS